VSECQGGEEVAMEEALETRRMAAQGTDFQALEKAIAEAERLGLPPDAVANARLHELRPSVWPWSR